MPVKILLSGGGTLGPVVPLLAVAEAFKVGHPEASFVWVGTKDGPEKELLTAYNIPYHAITAAKWRRYFSFWNVVDFLKFIYSFFQSLRVIYKEKPDLLISAGGFVSVPVHFAGALFGLPAWIHQQDRRPGLANRMMAHFAKKITVALKENTLAFSGREAEWIGNPTRDLSVADMAASRQKFNLPVGAPVIFALGGGTGSARINQLILEALTEWPVEWQALHLVGRERQWDLAENAAKVFPNYHVYQFFTEEMKDAYAVADVVITRAGFSTITELASLSKAVILLPMSGTHQEDNAVFLAEAQAAIVLDERAVSGAQLTQIVKDLLENKEKRDALGARLHEVLPPSAPVKIVEIIEGMIKK